MKLAPTPTPTMPSHLKKMETNRVNRAHLLNSNKTLNNNLNTFSSNNNNLNSNSSNSNLNNSLDNTTRDTTSTKISSKAMTNVRNKATKQGRIISTTKFLTSSSRCLCISSNNSSTTLPRWPSTPLTTTLLIFPTSMAYTILPSSLPNMRLPALQAALNIFPALLLMATPTSLLLTLTLTMTIMAACTTLMRMPKMKKNTEAAMPNGVAHNRRTTIRRVPPLILPKLPLLTSLNLL
mmetsp:Transcript_5764/g.8945  ORF Transcript_5764/g.8945 Transcript_5764/m.8945 type:complete len:236 (+) Transcript_5764:329-1036(+)